MKIGICTILYENYNYGGVLQAFALQKVLDGFDGTEGEVLLLDRRKMVKYPASGSEKRSIGVYADKTVNYVLKSVLNNRRKAFCTFISTYIRCSSSVYNSNNIHNANILYDSFIAGSDQVWSPISGCEGTFLEFCDNPNKKNSYAASIGENYISDDFSKYLYSRINDFANLSVREKTAANLLANIISHPVEVVLDPVFLLDKNAWRVLACKETCYKVDKPYCLIYLLGDGYQNINLAIKICKKKKLKPLMIPYGKMKIRVAELFAPVKKAIDAGPSDFVNLIANAELVITDSFHCLAFSIIFNRDFYCVNRSDNNRNVETSSRLNDLMEEFDITDRWITQETFKSKGNDNAVSINWDFVEGQMDERRRESMAFLQKIIDGVKN